MNNEVNENALLNTLLKLVIFSRRLGIDAHAESSDLLYSLDPLLSDVKESKIQTAILVFLSLLFIILFPLFVVLIGLYAFCKCDSALFKLMFATLLFTLPLYISCYLIFQQDNSIGPLLILIISGYHYLEFYINVLFRELFLGKSKIADSVKCRLAEIALIQAKHFEIVKESFKFTISKGDDDKIKQHEIIAYGRQLIPGRNRMEYSGVQLIINILCTSPPISSTILVQVMNYLIILGRIAGFLVPLIMVSEYKSILDNDESLFIGIFYATVIINFCILPVWTTMKSISEGSLKEYLYHLRVATHLISTGRNDLNELENTGITFKMNLFCPQSLTTWGHTIQLIQNAWMKSILQIEAHILMFIVYLLVFATAYVTTLILEVSEEPMFAYGYVWNLMDIEILSFFIPLVYHLYYGYKINKFYSEIEVVLNNLLEMYSTLLTSIDPLMNSPSIKSKRYEYLRQCLIDEIPVEYHFDISSYAGMRLERLQKKVKSILADVKENSQKNIYKFCGVVPCTGVAYQSLLVSIAGVVSAAASKYFVY